MIRRRKVTEMGINQDNEDNDGNDLNNKKMIILMIRMKMMIITGMK